MSGKLKVASGKFWGAKMRRIQRREQIYPFRIKRRSFMEKDRQKKQRRIAKINGVKIVNAENSKKQQEKPQKDATAVTRNLIWLMDKDNLEL